MVRLKHLYDWVFRYFNLFLVAVNILLATSAESAIFFTADADMRYKMADSKRPEFKVEALGIGVRKVFADRMGDRIILFPLLETMDNLKETMLDQAYLQYKGPLGRWNITTGRYRLPFGLLSSYSTKRLLIKTLEYETIGIESDNGILLSGIIKDFDYALSLSQGVGTERWSDIDNEGLMVFRVGYQGIDFEALRIGLSGCLGRVLPKKGHNQIPNSTLYKKILSIDLTKYHGVKVYRAEVSFGEEEKKRIFSAFLGIDWSIFPKLDLNVGHIYLNKHSHETGSVTLGLTYNVYGVQIRAGQRFSFIGEEKDEFSLQVYRLFNYSL